MSDHKTKGPFRPFDFEVIISGFFGDEMFHIRISPEGVERFRIPAERSGIREPLLNVLEQDEEIVVLAEVPGAEKEKIEIEAREDSLTISASNHNRKYYKELILPAKVDPKSGRAIYKNGLLEIRFKKLEKRKGERISVE
ncbi:MAG: Hsp20/alpha crystallin family protein [Nitrososphaerota archaeon]